MFFRNRTKLSFLALVAGVVMFASSALAVAPSIMPGFPMRAGPMVMLLWTPVPGASEYKVMRRTTGGEWAQVAKQPAPPFNDVTADASTGYDYQVIPVINGADGEASAIGSLAGKVKLPTPEISGIRNTHKDVLIRWSPIRGVAFYNLYRADGAADAPFNLVGSIQDTNYNDVTVSAETKYFYKVAAVDNASAESDHSAVREVTTDPEPKVVKTVKLVKEIWEPLGETSGEEDYPMKSPQGIYVDSAQQIHIPEFKSVQVLDANGDYVTRYGANAAENWGRLGTLAFDPSGTLAFVCYYSDSVIRVFDTTSGELQMELTYEGVFNEERGKLMKPNPNAVAIDLEGYVYVADGVSYQLIVLDPNTNPPYQEVARVGNSRFSYVKGEENPASDFSTIGMVYFSPFDNKLYVGEKSSALIKVLDPAKIKALKPDERVLDIDYTFGGTGTQPYNLSGLASIAFTDDGTIFVADALLGNIIRFTWNAETSEYDYISTMVGDTEELIRKNQLGVPFLSGCDYDQTSGVLYCTSSMLNIMAGFQKQP